MVRAVMNEGALKALTIKCTVADFSVDEFAVTDF
jgi:hypothetical protein